MDFMDIIDDYLKLNPREKKAFENDLEKTNNISEFAECHGKMLACISCRMPYDNSCYINSPEYIDKYGKMESADPPDGVMIKK